jgi:Ni,Fe-hydrogenase maturation factor
VDADQRQHPAGFVFDRIKAVPTHRLTSHQLDPATVLSLCEEIYDHSPKAYLLGISGVDFRLALGLSTTAEKHLEDALQSFERKVLEGTQKVNA